MKERTKMNGLVYHAKPSGKTYQSGQNKCYKKLQKLETLIREGYKLTDVKKKPTEDEKFKVIITCFGPMKITIEEYNAHCKQEGF